jgi:hypothetical protein
VFPVIFGDPYKGIRIRYGGQVDSAHLARSREYLQDGVLMAMHPDLGCKQATRKLRRPSRCTECPFKTCKQEDRDKAVLRSRSE